MRKNALTLTLIMICASLAGCLDGIMPLTDDDADGVMNDVDLCLNTPAGETVDADGCSSTQLLDDDVDGVLNHLDLCPLTLTGEAVDTDGCSQTQLDDDGDGVMNNLDLCPNTPPGTTVDSTGCEVVAVADADADGVADADDQCPNTPPGTTVDSTGCEVVAVADADGDGVADADDLCPNTPAGTIVDSTGCEVVTVADADGDGVADTDDQCPLTPIGETVDAEGCHGGSVITWGNSGYGGDSSSVSSQLSSRVVTITSSGWTSGWSGPSNKSAFAALKSDGSVVTWGSESYGGDSSLVNTDLNSGVIEIYSNWGAFAALKSDGSIVTWGDSDYGGDSSSVVTELSAGVVDVFSTFSAFAALKDDGSVVTWGGYSGGDSSSVSTYLNTDVVNIFSTEKAFAALKSDSSVVTWGVDYQGGDSSSVSTELSSNVVSISSNSVAFAALKSDGSVVTWGQQIFGGDSSSVSTELTSNIVSIYSNALAFAALKSDGSVVTWGRANSGGDSISVGADLSSGVINIFSSGIRSDGNGFGSAFAALKSDGSVVTWGGENAGGDSSSVSSDLSSGIEQIFSTSQGAFAALKVDGSVVTWGGGFDGAGGGDSSSVSADLSSNVVHIFSTGYSFAALKSDGSVVTWGGWGMSDGGDSSSVSTDLSSGVTWVYSSTGAFAAIVGPIADADADGVADSDDQCPNTPPGTTVDSTGCSTSQSDSDGDGIVDSADQCPNTPAGETVDANGCSSSQLDSDGDGVMDSDDLCPNTPAGAIIDSTGCEFEGTIFSGGNLSMIYNFGDSIIFLDCSYDVGSYTYGSGKLIIVNLVSNVQTVLTNGLIGNCARGINGYVVNGYFVFDAFSLSSQQSQGDWPEVVEIWVTDGTTTGTHLLKDINPSSDDYREDCGSSANKKALLGNELLFSANDGSTGCELWKTDGTETGTVMVKDINPFNTVGDGSSNPSLNGNSYPYHTSLVLADTLYFSADSGVGGVDLWKTDGTESGTMMVKDMTGSSTASHLTAVGSQIYFQYNDGEHGTELWITDGTDLGTMMVKDINPSTCANCNHSSPRQFVSLGLYVFFFADDGTNGYELWKTGGTDSDTTMVKDINPNTGSIPTYSLLKVFNNELYFIANDGQNGYELWKSDGTELGTLMVVDLTNDQYNGFCTEWSAPGGWDLIFGTNEFLFRGKDGLWNTDGTAQGTSLLESFYCSDYQGLVVKNTVSEDNDDAYFISRVSYDFAGWASNQLFNFDKSTNGLTEITPLLSNVEFMSVVMVHNSDTLIVLVQQQDQRHCRIVSIEI